MNKNHLCGPEPLEIYAGTEYLFLNEIQFYAVEIELEPLLVSQVMAMFTSRISMSLR